MNLRAILRQPVVTVAFHESDVRWTIGSPGRIASSGRAPLPPGLIDDGVIRDVMAAGEALRTSPGFRGSARMRAVAALPSPRSVFRQIELPALRGRQFAELVEREIRRELPMLAENAYVSWKQASARDGKAQVFVAGIARDVLDSHASALRAAGLQPVAVDLRVIAAARATGAADCIMAYAEAQELELAIFRDGVPSIVRYVPLTAPCGDAAWGVQVTEELARTLKFYRDSHRDDEVAGTLPISFVGGAAQQAILSEGLVASTGHEVAMPPLELSLTPPEETPRFAANIGLALKDLAA